MKRAIVLILTSLMVVILQQTLLSSFTMFGVVVDAVFVYVVCIATLRDEVESVSVALFTGIIRDCLAPRVFGINTITFLVTAYIVSIVQKKIYKNSIFIPILFSFVFTFLKEMIYFSFMYVISIKFSLSQERLLAILREGALNAVLCIILYQLLYKLNSMEFMEKEWKF